MDAQPSTPSRVLIVEDDPISRRILAASIAPLGVEVVECASVDEAWDHLYTRPPDVVITDLMMPDVDGATFCRLIRGDERIREVMILMITAHTEREERLAALDAGVDDFLVKPVDRLDLRARVATACRLGRFRKLAEERARSDSLVGIAPIGVVVLGLDGVIHFANARAGELLGDVLTGAPLASRLDAPAAAMLHSWLTSPDPANALSGTHRWASATGERLFDVAAAPVQWTGSPALQLVLTDVTGLRRIEQQLHQQERIEAVGRLAASVAHDFATILQVCTMQVHALRAAVPPGVGTGPLEEISTAIHRGSLMTQDLLTFCRRPDAAAQQASCDAVAVLERVGRLGRRLVPQAIGFDVQPPAEPFSARMPAHALEQALINLISNARDATPREGAIAVRAEPVDGRLKITVHDTGLGMPATVAARVGEPFFTTKPEGQGTGLGLWMVRRTVEASGGTITIASRAGEGTTVTLVIPAASSDDDPIVGRTPSPDDD